jgi:hypothetical protein
MSVVHGGEAMKREADIAGNTANERLERAGQCRLPDVTASLALESLAHSARELCCLARLALEHLTEKKP